MVQDSLGFKENYMSYKLLPHTVEDFLPKNSLIFMFQKNIVKDEKIKKYHRWFEFAEITRNEDNTKEHFEKFRGDEVFEAIIKRINKSKLMPDDMQYIDIQKEDMAKFNRWEEGVREQSKRQGKIEGKTETAIICKKKGYPTKDISEITGLTEEEIDDI